MRFFLLSCFCRTVRRFPEATRHATPVDLAGAVTDLSESLDRGGQWSLRGVGGKPGELKKTARSNCTVYDHLTAIKGQYLKRALLPLATWTEPLS